MNWCYFNILTKIKSHRLLLKSTFILFSVLFISISDVKGQIYFYNVCESPGGSLTLGNGLTITCSEFEIGTALVGFPTGTSDNQLTPQGTTIQTLSGDINLIRGNESGWTNYIGISLHFDQRILPEDNFFGGDIDAKEQMTVFGYNSVKDIWVVPSNSDVQIGSTSFQSLQGETLINDFSQELSSFLIPNASGLELPTINSIVSTDLNANDPNSQFTIDFNDQAVTDLFFLYALNADGYGQRSVFAIDDLELLEICPESTCNDCIEIDPDGCKDLYIENNVPMVCVPIVYNGTNEELECNAPINGLLGYYPFEDNSLDVSGTNLHGTEHGTTLAYVNGVDGKAVEFNNIDGNLNDYLSFPEIDVDEFTVSFWANYRSSTIPYGSMLYSMGNTKLDTAFQVEYVTSQQGIRLQMVSNFGSGSLQYFNTGFSNLEANEWHHITASFNSTTTKFYIDGQLFDERALSFVPDFKNKPFFLAYHEWDQPSGGHRATRFNGLIDEMHVYDRTLDLSEIQELMGCASDAPQYVNSINLDFNFAQEHLNYSDITLSDNLPVGSIYTHTINQDGSITITIYGPNGTPINATNLIDEEILCVELEIDQSTYTSNTILDINTFGVSGGCTIDLCNGWLTPDNNSTWLTPSGECWLLTD